MNQFPLTVSPLEAISLPHYETFRVARLVGACAGFLPSNFPVANFFLGDSGSTVLGFCGAFLALDLYRARPTSGPVLLFPFLIAGIPLLDAGFAVIRRLRSRGSPLQGDRRHIYDLLSARGWSPRQIAFVSYGVTLALVAIGLLGVRMQSRVFWAVSFASLGLMTFVAIRLGALRSGQRGKTVSHNREQITEGECRETSQTG